MDKLINKRQTKSWWASKRLSYPERAYLDRRVGTGAVFHFLLHFVKSLLEHVVEVSECDRVFSCYFFM
jgi:hypothetical protein